MGSKSKPLVTRRFFITQTHPQLHRITSTGGVTLQHDAVRRFQVWHANKPRSVALQSDLPVQLGATRGSNGLATLVTLFEADLQMTESGHCRWEGRTSAATCWQSKLHAALHSPNLIASPGQDPRPPASAYGVAHRRNMYTTSTRWRGSRVTVSGKTLRVTPRCGWWGRSLWQHSNKPRLQMRRLPSITRCWATCHSKQGDRHEANT